MKHKARKRSHMSERYRGGICSRVLDHCTRFARVRRFLQASDATALLQFSEVISHIHSYDRWQGYSADERLSPFCRVRISGGGP